MAIELPAAPARLESALSRLLILRHSAAVCSICCSCGVFNDIKSTARTTADRTDIIIGKLVGFDFESACIATVFAHDFGSGGRLGHRRGRDCGGGLYLDKCIFAVAA